MIFTITKGRSLEASLSSCAWKGQSESKVAILVWVLAIPKGSGGEGLVASLWHCRDAMKLLEGEAQWKEVSKGDLGP